MIIYNVTIKIAAEAAEEWLQWMSSKHIPDVMATGSFSSYQINKVISHQEQDDDPTFAIQYTCADMATLHQYHVKHAPALQEEHTQRYKDQFVAFRTLLEVIEQSGG
jgi:hypothetical protein